MEGAEKTIGNEIKQASLLDVQVPAMFTLDNEFNFIHINEQALLISGGNKNDFSGQSIFKFIPQRFHHDIRSLFQRLKVDSPAISYRFKWTKQGSKHSSWFECLLTCIFNNSGAAEYFIGIIRDIQLHHHTQRLNDKIQFVLQANHSVIFDISIKTGEVIYVSPNVEELTGYTLEEHIKQPLLHFNIIHDADFNRVFEIYQNITELQTAETEYRIIHKSGKIKWMQIKVSLLKNKTNEPIGLTGVVTDITSKKLSKTLLEGVLGSSLGGIFVANTVKNDSGEVVDFKWVVVNRAAQEIFSINPDEYIGKTLLVDSELKEKEQLFIFLKKAISEGKSQVKEEKSLLIGGQEMFFKVVADPLDKFVVLTYQDITQRIKSREALNSAIRDYEILFDGSIDAKFLVQVLDSGKYMYQRVNKKYTEITGIQAEQIIGKSPDEVFDRELATVIESKYKVCINTQSPLEYEFTANLPTGFKIMKSTLVPVFDKGKVIYLAGSTRDFTDLKMQAETLRLTEAKMQGLFDSLLDTILIIDHVGKVIEYHQPESASYPHFLLDEPAGKILSEVCNPGCIDDFNHAIELYKKENKTVSFEFSVEQNGASYWYLASLSHIDLIKDNLQGYLILSRDITSLREKEEKLKESEEKFKDLFENANDLIQSVDSEGKFIYTNPAWHKTLGYSSADLEKMTVFDIIHQDSKLKCKGYFERIMSGENLDAIETILIAKNGTQVMVEGSSSCRFVNGVPYATRTIFRDITQKKQAEREIEASRLELRKLALVTQKTENAVLLINSNGLIEWVNPAFYQLTGFDNEVINEGYYPHVVAGEEIGEQDNKDIIHSVKTGKNYRGVVLHFKKDGATYWADIEIQPVYSDSGDILLGSMVIESDMTERRKIQETLTYRYEFQRALVETATSFINIPLDQMDNMIRHALSYIGSFLRVDRAYLYLYDLENRTLSNVHDWRAPYISNQNFMKDSLPIDDLPELVRNHLLGRMNQINDIGELPADSPYKSFLLQNQIVSQITLPLIHLEKCLGFVGFDMVMEPRRWSEDEIGMLRVLVELFTNLLIRKQYETELVEAKNAAEKATYAKSRFLANMSHEIRTPMNGVIGFLDLLSRTRLNEEQSGYLNEAQNASDMLMHIINDILDLSKIEADKLLLERKDFRLNELIDNTVLLLAPIAYKKGLELNSFFAPGNIDHVLGDSARLKQILTNLIGNAIKFTEEGEINVITETHQLNEGIVEVRIKVRDTGIGMNEEVINNLFQPFVQGDTSTTRKYGGTGLGLSITKKLVELMDGEIKVESNPGKGSEFSVIIYLLKSAEERVLTEDELPDLSDQKILVVDDNASNLMILKQYLDRTGAVVEVTESAEKAIQLLYSAYRLQQPFSAAVIDHQLPGMDGTQLAKVIRSVPEVRNIKLILLSSLQNKFDPTANDNSSFDGVLSKPVKRLQLLSKLENIIRYQPPTSMEKLSPDTSINPDIGIDPGTSILLVEDQEINARLLNSYMESLGISCDIAQNGQEAVEICSRKKFGLIIMDCQMPVMDGFEATRKIRNSDNLNNSTPIIALTAYAMEGDREKCLAAGMDDYLSKPVNLNQLHEHMSIHLRHKVSRNPNSGTEYHGDKLSQPESGNMRDIVIYNFLNDTGLKKETVIEIFELFFESLPRDLEQLSLAIEKKDYQSISWVSHKLKGTAGNLMINEIAEIAGKIEASSKKYEEDLCKDYLHKLKLKAQEFLINP